MYLMKWFEKLKYKWKLTGTQLVIVLLVFACTGTTVLLLKHPVLNLLIPGGYNEWWHSVVYYILILPIYNIVLLFYGFLFGQFSFFWEFEKRMFSRLLGRNKRE